MGLQRKQKRRITLLYGTALSCVALLSVAAWWTLRTATNSEERNAEIINVAGRQRMLCQRIALLAGSGEGSRSQLMAAIQAMRTGNRRLLEPKSDLPMKALMGEAYLEQSQSLRAAVEDFLVAAENRHLPETLIEQAEALLPRLESFVQHAESSATAQNTALKHQEDVLVTATLLLLLLEALFIFRPMAARLSDAFAGLEAQRLLDRREKALLQVVVDQIGDGLVVTDLSGRVVELASVQFQQWFGASVVDRPLSSILPELNLPMPLENLPVRQFDRSGRKYSARGLRFSSKDGVEHFLLVLRDITQEHENRKRRRREAESIAGNFRSVPDVYQEFCAETRALLRSVNGASSSTDQIQAMRMLLGAVAGVGFHELTRALKEAIREIELSGEGQDASAPLSELFDVYVDLVDQALGDQTHA